MDSSCDCFDVWSFFGLLDVWIFVFFTTGIEFSRGFKLVVYRILKFTFFSLLIKLHKNFNEKRGFGKEISLFIKYSLELLCSFMLKSDRFKG